MISKELKELLRCPICSSKLREKGKQLTCAKKHSFQLGKIAILLPERLEPEKANEMQEEDEMATHYKGEREKDTFSIIVNTRWNKTITGLVDFKPKMILELGCGSGMLTKHLLETYPNATVLGFDLSRKMAVIANEKNPGKIFVADAEHIPLKSNSFDLIVARGVLHHLPELDKVLKEVSRLLKVRGTFVFSEPNNFNPLLRIYRTIGRKHRGYTPEKLKKLLKKGGFSVETEDYFGFFTFPFAVPDLLTHGKKLRKLGLFRIFTKIDLWIEKSFLKRMCWHLVFKCRKI